MISFFILFILIIVLLYSEYIGKINKPTNKELFTDFKSVVNLGRCSQSLTQTMKKLDGYKVIDPFNLSTEKPFNWDNYFNNANFKQSAINEVFY